MSAQEETPAEFLADRADWLRVAPVETEGGSWAVVLVLDGYYADRDWGDGMAEHFAERLGKALGLDGPLPVGLMPDQPSS